jgi:hypothetical protein
MSHPDCPEFLRPRLRLFLSADIIGSTALKQSRLGALGSDKPSTEASWFTTIQGFYFEAQQLFRREWEELQAEHDSPEYFGEPPKLWKTIGDEVLFTKLITDHRQLAITIQCWVKALEGIRRFLTRESSRLGVKSTAWTAGFPFRNKEVVLSGAAFSATEPIEDYYRENGIILDGYYQDPVKSDVVIDYVGPSIDTGFRLTGLSTARKFIVSLEVAYILSITSSTKTSPILPINLHYDGQTFLKGVLGGTNYPIFWLDLSNPDSAAAREDRLTNKQSCNRDAVQEFCDAFFAEHKDLIFPPFIVSDTETIITVKPAWYDEKHGALVKNFYESYLVTPEPEEEPATVTDDDYRTAVDTLNKRIAELQKKWAAPVDEGDQPGGG